MKKTREIAATLLVALAFLAGCTENPALQARYQAEKMFFQAEKAARKASIRPDLNNPAYSDQIHQLYDSTLTFCYRALDSFANNQNSAEYRELTLIAYRAATRSSQFYFAEDKFDSCVSIFGRLLQTVKLDGMANITAHLSLGQALQSAGQWDSALSVYSYSLENFYPPSNKEGRIIVNLFNLPNRIYDVYVRVGDSIAAEEQVEIAENYYRQLISDYPGRNLAGAGHLSLAGLYERLGRWDDAVNELVRLTDTSGSIVSSAGMRIASLHASQLDRPDLAIEQYDQILQGLHGRDTLQRPMVLFNKGLVYLYQQEYRLARQIMTDVKNSYPRFYRNTPTVQFAIARTFELQGNWDRAEENYRHLIVGFPTSEQSLSTYLYLIDQYSQRGRPDEARLMEERAETQYNELATTRPGTLIEAVALSYKAELMRRRAQWQAAIDLLVDVFHRYPTSEIGFRDMITAALIYRDDLNNPVAADLLIEELKRRLTTVDESQEM